MGKLLTKARNGRDTVKKMIANKIIGDYISEEGMIELLLRLGSE